MARRSHDSDSSRRPHCAWQHARLNAQSARSSDTSLAPSSLASIFSARSKHCVASTHSSAATCAMPCSHAWSNSFDSAFSSSLASRTATAAGASSSAKSSSESDMFAWSVARGERRACAWLRAAALRSSQRSVPLLLSTALQNELFASAAGAEIVSGQAHKLQQSAARVKSHKARTRSKRTDLPPANGSIRGVRCAGPKRFPRGRRPRLIRSRASDHHRASPRAPRDRPDVGDRETTGAKKVRSTAADHRRRSASPSRGERERGGGGRFRDEQHLSFYGMSLQVMYNMMGPLLDRSAGTGFRRTSRGRSRTTELDAAATSRRRRSARRTGPTTGRSGRTRARDRFARTSSRASRRRCRAPRAASSSRTRRRCPAGTRSATRASMPRSTTRTRARRAASGAGGRTSGPPRRLARWSRSSPRGRARTSAGPPRPTRPRRPRPTTPRRREGRFWIW
mmetsp:Transcript_8995/g.28111  ORF Transcript_8995/g.28111 Transcript_8995/m.28111 type:complete len:453 (+) Transcript_8995:423-1781(+)